MGKLTVSDIARVLMDKNGLEKREANSFVSEMFSLIQQRLATEQLVKVKGLGTFKVISVEARESVSVRTGERVVIGSHDKVSFVPDKLMSELVNRPFSQFETVVLNEGVEFADMQEEEKPEPEISEPELTEPTEPENSEPEPETIEPEPENTEPEPELLVTPEPELASSDDATDTMDTIEIVETADTDDVEDADDTSRPWGRWLLSALGVLLLMAFSAYGGYRYGLQQSSPALLLVADTTVRQAALPVVADTLSADMLQRSAVPQQQDTVPPRQATLEKKDTVTATVADPYAAKDVRVRLGAYRIVGTDREVTVRAGQTLSGISRANLGPDMECYVEVYNDLRAGMPLKEGQTLKIPKLQLKKRKK